jgi:hypothetical protein
VTALALGVVLAIVSPVAYGLFGAMGLVAAAMASVVVFFAAFTGILLDVLYRQSRRPQSGTAMEQNQDVLWRLLFGMATRTVLPLASCLVVQLSGGPLASAGFAYFVLVFYFAALFLETWSLVGRHQESSRQG